MRMSAFVSNNFLEAFSLKSNNSVFNNKHWYTFMKVVTFFHSQNSDVHIYMFHISQNIVAKCHFGNHGGLVHSVLDSGLSS